MNKYRLLFVIFALTAVACQKIEDIISKDDDICSKMEDIIFMQFCYDNYDVNHDGKVSKSEAEAVSKINMYCERKSIGQYGELKSLKGLEYFTNLVELDCTRTNLSFIDVSRNKKLEVLALGGTDISSLNTTKCPALKELYVWGTNITQLDVTKNTELIELDAEDLNISEIDVSHCTKLKNLYLSHTNVTELDISNNELIVDLDFGKEGLTVRINCVKVPYNYRSYGDGVVFSCNGKIIPSNCYISWDGKVYDNYSRVYIDIGVGESITVQAIPYPDNAEASFNWLSSDDNVATVNGGMITGKKEGYVSIFAIPTTGGKRAECYITVKPAVKSVKIYENEKPDLMKVGEYWRLIYSQTPYEAADRGAQWSSSNPDVVAIVYLSDNFGNKEPYAKAIAPGKATISVKTISGGISSTSEVNVIERIVPVTSVLISPSKLNLTAGETYELTTIVNPSNATNKTVSWSSSNTAVAAVSSDGTVTANAAGSATITCTTQDGGKKATCSVSVKTATIFVTGVSLNNTSLSLQEGETSTLEATVSPSNATNNAVTWSSSNTDVATVTASGVVTANSAGSATITCTTKDGSKTATCKVTVTKPVTTVSVTGVSLNKTSLSLTVGDSQKLTSTVQPSNATNKSVTWKSSSTAVATVDANGNVKAVKAGSATITCTTQDGSKNAKCYVTVTKNNITGISIPDPGFKEYLLSVFDKDLNGEISKNEALEITEIYIGAGVSSFEGIEYMENLKKLYCACNNIKSLDISKNVALEELYCQGNKISTLNLSKNKKLKHLSCYENLLTSLDLSNNPELEFISCYSNKLTSLDVSKNISLQNLHCGSQEKTLTVYYSNSQPKDFWSKESINKNTVWKMK